MPGSVRPAALVGRERELEVAEELLDDALRGHPRVLLMVGEAGIGKSTLARRIAERAVASGFRSLWGVGQENLPVPYLPLRTALSPLVGEDEDPFPLVEPEADETAAWATVTEAAVHAAAATGMVLVVDDAQWFDPASQALLLHLLAVLDHAAESRPVRALTVVTVRTPVVDQRVQRTVDRLRREPGTHVVTIDGLERVKVQDLLIELTGMAPSAGLVSKVQEATGGNPLLVSGVVRRGFADGTLHPRSGVLDTEQPHLAITQADLDQSVVDRLGEVSARCHDLLTLAAFDGELTLGELAELAGVGATDATTLLDEAVEADLVEDRADRVVFVHPQVRHVLFHAPTRRARQTLHLRIADALERRRDDMQAAAISHHLSRAGGQAASERVWQWASLAASQARATSAWADALVAARQALDAAPDDVMWTTTADLHILAVTAASHDFDGPAAEVHGVAAIALAREHDDAERWAQALLHMARTIVTNVATPSRVDQAIDLLRELLDHRPTPPDSVRAPVLALLAEILAARGQVSAAVEAAEAARALLTEQAPPAQHGLVLVADGLARWEALDLTAARRSYDAALALGEDHAAARWYMYARVRGTLVSHLSGDVTRARREASATISDLDSRQVWGEQALAAAAAASGALAQGDFDDAERLVAVAERSARRSGFVDPRAIGLPALAQSRALRGDDRGAHDAIRLLVEAGGGGGRRYELAVAALAGDADEARRSIHEHPWSPPPTPPTLRTLSAAVLHAELATATAHEMMAAQAVPALLGAHEQGVVLTLGWVALISRLVGECEAVQGHLEGATEWLDRAATEARRLGLRLEQARVELAWARLAAVDVTSADGQAQRARSAARRLDALGALPLVAAARRLAHAGAEEEAPARRVILFTDIVDSTGLNVRAGDQRWLDLLREHDEITREALTRHRGVAFKHTGDGVAAWFDTSPDAIACALRIHRDLARVSRLHPDLIVAVGAGIDAGEPLGHEGDLFGLTVVRASRLCEMAGAGEVITSAAVAADAHRHGIRSTPLGAVSLKGFPQPEDAHRVVVDVRSEAR